MSSCTIATSDPYTIPITESSSTVGVQSATAAGNSGNAKRRKPYVPIFSSTPASTTEPAVGASTCASGSQVWSGNIGTLIANASANAPNSQNWVCHQYSLTTGISVSSSAGAWLPGGATKSNVYVPVCCWNSV